VLADSPGQTSKASIPPDLETIANAWPNVPAAIKQGILAMVEAATRHHGEQA